MQSHNCNFLCLKIKILNKQSVPNIELNINRNMLLVALNSLKGVCALVPTKKANFMVRNAQADASNSQTVCMRCIIFFFKSLKNKLIRRLFLAEMK